MSPLPLHRRTTRRRAPQTRPAMVLVLLALTASAVGLSAPPAFAAVAAAPTGIDRVVSASGVIDSSCGSGIPAGTPVNTTIQAAVNALGITQGQQIYVCAGTYTENVIVALNNVDLIGPNWNDPSGGSDPAIIQAAVPALPAVTFTSASTTDNGVRGFTIDGGTYGVLAQTGDGCCWDDPSTEGIVNNVFTDQTAASIETRGLNSGTISGNTITPAAGADGIVMINQYGLMNVEANTITLSGDAVGITTKQDVAYGPTASGLGNIGGATPAQGNTITGGTTGVLVQSLDNEVALTGYIDSPLIQNNTLSNQTGDAVVITDATAGAEIYDNTIDNPGGSGILIAGATTNLGYTLGTTLIYRNDISSAGRDGVEITGYVTTVLVGDALVANANTITDPARDGISATGFQTDTQPAAIDRDFSIVSLFAYYNQITGAGDDGVDVHGTYGAYIRYNAITDATANGIEEDFAKYLWNEYNQIKGSGENGVTVADAWAGEVDFNSISGSGADGIHIADVWQNYVWQNRVTSNGDDGIELTGATHGYLVYYNTSSGNGNGGIRFTGAISPMNGIVADPSFVAFNNVGGNTGLDCQDQMPGTQTENGTYAGTTGNVWWSNLNYSAADDQPAGICMGNTLTASSSFYDGEVGNAYFGATPTVSNGTGPYTWSLPPNPDGSAGTLPAGLTLNTSTGQITGTPTAAVVEFPLVLKVTDAAGVTGQVAGVITIYPTLVASDGTKTGTTGAPITPFNPTVTGGNPDTAKTFSVAPGSASALPPGLSLDPVTGAVTGTPSSSGTYAVTFKVTDNSPNMEDTASLPAGSPELPANADTYVVTFTITAGPVVADGSFGRGMEGYPYTSFTPTVTGGDGGPYTWSTTSPLPSGLTLDPATGVISGTPATGTQGTWPITLTATDGSGASDSFTADLAILPFDPSAPMANPVVAAGALAALALGAIGLRHRHRRRGGASATA